MNSLTKAAGYLGACLAVLAILTACAPLTVINAITPKMNSRLVSGIAYGDGLRRKLDVFTPIDKTAAAPVVVFFYGGSWNSGSRADYAFVGRALAARGMVVVIADYRLYPEVRYPAFLEDSAQAVSWTSREIALYGGDPKRLFLMGHSAGAYHAAMLALDKRWLGAQGMTPDMLSGWIGMAGPYDFIPIENPDVKPVFFFPDTPLDSQPVMHVSAKAPPSLLIAARTDPVVDPVRNSGAMAQKLRAQGVKVTERYFDDVSHATLVASLASTLRFLAPALDEVTTFVLAEPNKN